MQVERTLQTCREEATRVKEEHGAQYAAQETRARAAQEAAEQRYSASQESAATVERELSARVSAAEAGAQQAADAARCAFFGPALFSLTSTTPATAK